MLTGLQQLMGTFGIHTDVSTFLVLFGLILARLAAAVSLTPFMGGKSVNGRIKVGLAMVMSLLLFTSVAPQANLGELNTLRVMCLLIKEAVIGATLGFLSQIVFDGIQMAGAMVDYGRGMSQATFLAPQLETNVSLLGQLQFQAALVLFLLLNGHLVFLRALAASFQSVPLLDFPHFSGGTMASVEQMAHYSGESLLIAVQLSAPALLALFLVDVSFGILGKVASGLHVHNESQPVKALLGLGVVFLSLSYIMSRMPTYFAEIFRQTEQFFRNLR